MEFASASARPPMRQRLPQPQDMTLQAEPVRRGKLAARAPAVLFFQGACGWLSTSVASALSSRDEVGGVAEALRTADS
eukprot:CAMPEP_0171217042 /NCGR_PEP_ID=MMETSP0790-20130122/32486_1 /TAXON_ID=2925 /ORGANISM="Alexandrium catenella, Strain OF101" /LENGTH=77 /DNA_ID=CAMNT_0011682829 /DNA_START=122 /DNA_END=352 /DNA_ORIENTATION=+